MISQFFILSPRGDTIILRQYLSNVPKVRRGAALSACSPAAHACVPENSREQTCELRRIPHRLAVLRRTRQRPFSGKCGFGAAEAMHRRCSRLMVSATCM